MTDDEKWAAAAIVALHDNLPADAREEILRDMTPLDRARVARAVAEHR